MQLKMSKPFNHKFVKQLLQEENIFISDLFSKISLPAYKQVDQTQQSKNEENGLSKAIYPVSGNSVNRARTFGELHAKLEELRGVRKLDYKQKMLKKNLKTRMKKKSKREERIMQKKLVRTEQLASKLSKPNEENGDIVKAPRPKPVFNSEGKMVFSKFDFSEIGTKKKPPKTPRDPKKLLQKLDEKKQRIRHLEESGEKDKVMEIAEKEAWKTVLAKSRGEKVKDDPDLLKRTIKRKEQRKKHSAKQWNSRIEGVKKSIQERQEKRQENIMKRKKEKHVKKLKTAAKRGKIIPGF